MKTVCSLFGVEWLVLCRVRARAEEIVLNDVIYSL